MASALPGLASGGSSISAPVGPSYSQTGAVSVGGINFPPKQPQNPVALMVLGVAVVGAAWIIARKRGG